MSNSDWYCLVSALRGSVRIKYQRLFIEVFECCHRQAADKFRNKSEFQIFRFHLGQTLTCGHIVFGLNISTETDAEPLLRPAIILSRPAKARHR